MEYTSPFIIENLLDSCGAHGSTNEEVGGCDGCDTPKHSDEKQLKHIADRVRKLMDNQHNALQGTKIQTYNRVARWMPFTTMLYFSSLRTQFDSLKPVKLAEDQLAHSVVDSVRANDTED